MSERSCSEPVSHPTANQPWMVLGLPQSPLRGRQRVDPYNWEMRVQVLS